jgi:hypothetical protein
LTPIRLRYSTAMRAGLMNAPEIRAAFRNFVGEDRYRRFVQQVVRDTPTAHQLRFWQDSLWREFVAVARDAPTELPEIRQVFVWCYVHDQPLDASPAWHNQPVLPWPKKMKDGRIEALPQQFPFSFGEYTCRTCLRTYDQWLATQDAQVLRQRTTWESYCATHALRGTAASKKALKVGAMFIETEMNEGDELWDWDAGDGQTGLAIVRDGKVRASWSAPIS